MGSYGFERGRVNVVLNDAGPAEGMEENRRFILDRRREGDGALDGALEQLKARKFYTTNQHIGSIEKLGKNIAELRKEVTKDNVIPKKERREGLPGMWFAAMTEYIESIESLLVDISDDISDADGIISRYSSIKHQTLALRNTAGPEMSILSATILSKEPLADGLAGKITALQVMTDYHFQAITSLSNPLVDFRIPDALKILKNYILMNTLHTGKRYFP